MIATEVSKPDAAVTEDQPRKIRVLAWGDYCCSTGFATVMSNIMRKLDDTGRFDITVVGINYTGDPYDTTLFPGRVFPAMPGTMRGGVYDDVYGRQRLLDLVAKGEFDVVYMLQDTFILETIMQPLLETQQLLQDAGRPFKIVYYFPIDAEPKKEWIDNVVAKIDFPVVYTKFGQDEIKKFAPDLAVPYIYHGTNLTDFFHIEDRDAVAAFRKAYFHDLADDRFLIMNVNRNQPRKDIVRSFMILAELKKRGRNPLLYMHMQHSDAGGNTFVMADQFGLQNEKDFVMPHPQTFNANQGIPIERLNLLYNAADAVLTTTLGEGWGLSITEAFATKTPVIGPDNTSLTEMMADNRGMLVPSGNTPSMFMVKENDLERVRPIMDVMAAADAIEAVMDGKGPDVDAAAAWAQEHSWDALVSKWWLPIIEEAADQAINPTKYMSRQERRAFERKQAKAAVKSVGF